MDDRRELEALSGALREAGVDPTDVARFVNRPNPDLPGFEPDTFDSRAAYPVLMEWLPRVETASMKETIARRLAQAGKRSETARALIREYRAADNDVVRWVLGDSIARVATPAEYDEVVELASSGDSGRQMLVYMLWRIKTDRSREVILEGIADSDVCIHAMYSLRRLLGNEEARRRIEPLLDHESERVREIAADTLKKIDKALSR
jgi:HEAT repeat protein